MAKKRLFKRDARGRFASSGGGSKRSRAKSRRSGIKKAREQEKITALLQAIKSRREFIRNDRGTAKQRAKDRAQIRKWQSQIKKLRSS